MNCIGETKSDTLSKYNHQIIQSHHKSEEKQSTYTLGNHLFFHLCGLLVNGLFRCQGYEHMYSYLVGRLCVIASKNLTLLREKGREVMWEMGRERREEGDGEKLVLREVNFINSERLLKKERRHLK
eukprot:TRINITY_DN11600_c0_g1_i1.p1 TRINITY_DN11600_c0_g1~~TRINITY_DN11600_c0_g1_i1.p1  ORF type:complete len:126 (-),score=17.87 TRINITY_DN11600_c0_g1_i1:1033-1410(-)